MCLYGNYLYLGFFVLVETDGYKSDQEDFKFPIVMTNVLLKATKCFQLKT